MDPGLLLGLEVLGCPKLQADSESAKADNKIKSFLFFIIFLLFSFRSLIIINKFIFVITFFAKKMHQIFSE